MMTPSSSRWPVLRELLSPRPVPADTRADRIRFMERDVGLTIKFFVLAAFSYFLYSPEWFEGAPSIGQIGLETIRGAFLTYLVLNVIIGGVLLAMDHLPLVLVEWSVFVVSLADSLFVALLVVVTGGLESTIYWVFLFIIVRNAVGTPMVRRQAALNAAVIVLFVFAGFLDVTWRHLGERYSAFDQSLGQAHSPTKSRPAHARTNTLTRPSAVQNPVATTNGIAGKKTNGKNSNPRKKGLAGDRAEPDFSEAALAAFESILNERAWERLLTRVLLLALLAASCYGINVLADLRLATLNEAREFTVRQEQLRSTGRLAAEIAHQLKNPLSIINNAAFNLQRSLRDVKPEAGVQLEIIREEINRSDRIITELMGYAQLSEGQVEKLNLADELDGAIAQALPPGAGYEITVKRDYHRELPPMLMQRAHLREIFVNILLNAREALHGKGGLEIMALPGESESVIITFKDDGPGIPAERLPRVFEPYFSTKEKGTGLGLAIVKHNTELYGGNVRVESELGKGTRFTLQFPAKALLRSTP